MNDLTRAEVIEELTEQAEAYQKLIDNGSFNKEAYSKSVECLKYAIDSLKTDEAYQLEYENRDFIEIPENATNGDMIKAVFPNAEFYNAMPFTDSRWETMNLDTENETRATSKPTQLRTYADWWNSPYRKEQE